MPPMGSPIDPANIENMSPSELEQVAEQYAQQLYSSGDINARTQQLKAITNKTLHDLVAANLERMDRQAESAGRQMGREQAFGGGMI